MTDKAKNSLAKIAVWTLRIVTGAVFVFSGFVKAVDPWGGMYKMHEYMAAMDISVSYETECALAVLLAAAEFTLGITLIFGILRRVSTWALAAFMAVMTPLTLWIWLSDPVADCGCFGDALVLSNGMTFAKNVVLSVFAVLLIIYNRKCPSLVMPKLQWVSIILSLIYVGIISLIGFNVQPLVDFRDYKIGTQLADTDLVIFDVEGEDMSEVLEADSALILVVNDPARHGISRSRMQNQMQMFADSIGYEMFALIATRPDRLDAWAERLHANYPMYAADDTDLKAFVRGDAAVVVVKDGKIAAKTNLYNYQPDAFAKVSPSPISMAKPHTLSWLTAIYVALLLLLTMRIHLPKIIKTPTEKHTSATAS